MTVFQVYVGDLDDPTFKWENGNWNGNVPRALTPGFPNHPRLHLFSVIVGAIESGEFEGKQTDFGGWVAKVDKKKIEALIDQWYGPNPFTEGIDRYIRPQWEQLKQRVNDLEDGKTYGLVATEF